jgi:hypothetical protein
VKVTKIIDGTVAAGGTIEYVSDFSEVRKTLSLTVRATYNASATKGIRVYLLPSPDGSVFDSLEDAEAQGNYFDVAFAAGATKQATVPVVHSGMQMKVLIKNLDSSYSASVAAWLAEVPGAGVSRPVPKPLGVSVDAAGIMLPVDIQGQTITLVGDVQRVNGQVQTARDWSLDFQKLQNLDTALSQAINNLNLLKVAGTSLTGADWTQYFSALPAIRDRVNEISGVLASTTTPLGANGTYTSGSLTVSGYGRIVGTVFADQAGTLYIEQSSDGTNWDASTSVSVSASTPTSFSVEVVAPTARVRYVNGATAQTAFRLYVRARRV